MWLGFLPELDLGELGMRSLLDISMMPKGDPLYLKISNFSNPAILYT
jgi:hypothetical protein